MRSFGVSRREEVSGVVVRRERLASSGSVDGEDDRVVREGATGRGVVGGRVGRERDATSLAL